MRDSRLGLVVLLVGLAPALLKRSKPLARYVGDQLTRAGEFLKEGTEEEAPVAETHEVKSEAPPKVAQPKASAASKSTHATEGKTAAPKAKAKPKTAPKAAAKPKPKPSAPAPEA